VKEARQDVTRVRAARRYGMRVPCLRAVALRGHHLFLPAAGPAQLRRARGVGQQGQGTVCLSQRLQLDAAVWRAARQRLATFGPLGSWHTWHKPRGRPPPPTEAQSCLDPVRTVRTDGMQA